MEVLLSLIGSRLCYRKRKRGEEAEADVEEEEGEEVEKEEGEVEEGSKKRTPRKLFSE